MIESQDPESLHLSAIVKFTAGVVSGLAVIFLLSLGTTKPQPTSSSVQRQPASRIAYSTVGENPWSERMNTIEVNCPNSQKSEPQKHQMSARWLRVKIGPCSDVALETTIVNRTSGITASIFQYADKKISSDFFPLLSGDNRIWVHQKLPSGEVRVAELMVQRN